MSDSDERQTVWMETQYRLLKKQEVADADKVAKGYEIEKSARGGMWVIAVAGIIFGVILYVIGVTALFVYVKDCAFPR